MEKKCFLCNLSGTLIDFNKDSFKNCVSKLAFRKRKYFKYEDVQLTKESLDFVGYHFNCYIKVTVLPSKYKKEFQNFIKKHNIPPSLITSPRQSKTGNQIICLFCNHKQNKSMKLSFPQSDDSLLQIENKATSIDDTEILLKFQNQTVAYHKSCYIAYLTKEKQVAEEYEENSWLKYRHLHKQAFSSLTSFITDQIIENNQVMHLTELFSRYQALLFEFGVNEIEPEDIQRYQSAMLERKLLKKFGDSITIKASRGKHHKKIVYKTDLDISAIENQLSIKQNENSFENVAFHLRNMIKKMDPKPVSKLSTKDGEIYYEFDIAPILFDFMQNLITGPDISNNSTEAKVKVTTLCNDIISAVQKVDILNFE